MTSASASVAREVADRFRHHWGSDIASLEVSPQRVRGQVHGLFHVATSAADPTRVTLSGWDRDLTDLIDRGAGDGAGSARSLRAVDEAMAAARRRDVLPARPRRRAAAVGWAARRDAALLVAQRRASGEAVEHEPATAGAVAAMLRDLWPGVDVEQRGDDPRRASLSVRPYGGDRVVVGLSPRGALVVPIADGESAPLPHGRSSITDGSPSQILSALEAADEWLRTTAPTDEVLARPVIV